MTTALAPVDVEGAVVAYLGSRLADTHVATKLPNPATPLDVRVTRAGGDARNLIQSDARVLVECYAADTTAAFDLARLAYAHLWAVSDSFMTPTVWVSRVGLSEPVNFPDPTAAKRARYQFVAQLTTSLNEITLPDPTA